MFKLETDIQSGILKKFINTWIKVRYLALNLIQKNHQVTNTPSDGLILVGSFLAKAKHALAKINLTNNIHLQKQIMHYKTRETPNCPLYNDILLLVILHKLTITKHLLQLQCSIWWSVYFL